MPKTIDVHVLSPQNLSWKGKAKAIKGENSVGDFSILPEHANYITAIRGTVTVVQQSGADYSFEVGFGLLYCHSNSVQIFIQLPLGEQEQRRWWKQFSQQQPSSPLSLSS